MPKRLTPADQAVLDAALERRRFFETAQDLKIRTNWTCGTCAGQHGQAHPVDQSRVFVYVYPRDGHCGNLDPANMAITCTRCRPLVQPAPRTQAPLFANLERVEIDDETRESAVRPVRGGRGHGRSPLAQRPRHR